MPVSLRRLQTLADISSFSDIRLTADNTLERRSGFKAFFARIGDAFKAMTLRSRAKRIHAT